MEPISKVVLGSNPGFLSEVKSLQFHHFDFEPISRPKRKKNVDRLDTVTKGPMGRMINTIVGDMHWLVQLPFNGDKK